MVLVKARVTFEYIASEVDELTLRVGDVVTNVKQLDGGWWEGETNGKHGMFPENFVEVIQEEAVLSPKKPGSSLQKAKAIFAYNANEDDELDLAEGDIVDILDQEEEGWWQGICNGKEGMFPSNFVELISGESLLAEEKAPVLPAPPEVQHRAEAESKNLLGEALSNSAFPDDGDGKKAKPPGGMGFAISSSDLLKKLRPVSMLDDNKKTETNVEESNKPVQKVTPLKKGDGPDLGSKNRDPPDGGPTKRTAPAPPKEDAQSKPPEERYRVLYDYEPENSDELALTQDAIVVITNKDVCQGWWEGICDGKKGVFPNNFVEPCPPKTDEITRQLPKTPLLPPANKSPVLPVRGTKEERKDVPEKAPQLPPGRHHAAAEPKRPLLPEAARPSVPPAAGQRKPILPESGKAVPLPEQKKAPSSEPPRPAPPTSTEPKKPVPTMPDIVMPLVSTMPKPEIKKPPPPITKSKPVPPRPAEKPSGDESSSGNSIKNKLNATLGSGIARFPSVGKKPVPHPNGFGRTFSQSIKKAVPTPEPEQKPVQERKPIANEHKEEDANADDTSEGDKKDEQMSWDAPSSASVLSNVNKNRPKGPVKKLPAKYIQNKEKETEVTEQPPWKTELAQKEHSKQPQSAKEVKPVQASEGGEAASGERTEKPPVDEDAMKGMQSQVDLLLETMKGMEKKFMKHIEVLTNDLDEERKLRANLKIEVDRLKKQVTILQGQ